MEFLIAGGCFYMGLGLAAWCSKHLRLADDYWIVLFFIAAAVLLGAALGAAV